MMKSLIAFGGKIEIIDKLTLPTFFPFHRHKINNNYEIYYIKDEDGKFLNSVNYEIWFDKFVIFLEENDLSWIHMEVDTEYHSPEYSSFEGDSGTDNTLIETFYITTNIESTINELD